MKREEQEELLKEWQKRLGLRDWTIKLYPKCKPEEMMIDDAVGVCNWKETNKTATIQILNPKYCEDCIEPMDWEETLVHELLHIKTCLVTDVEDPMTERVGHILINDLARAFVDAKRSK